MYEQLYEKSCVCTVQQKRFEPKKRSLCIFTASAHWNDKDIFTVINDYSYQHIIIFIMYDLISPNADVILTERLSVNLNVFSIRQQVRT